jgi:hypothetical protein
MALLDRLLFWTAERRGYHVIDPQADSVRVPPQTFPEYNNQKIQLQRKLDHVNAMAESFGLRVPAREESDYVDFR